MFSENGNITEVKETGKYEDLSEELQKEITDYLDVHEAGMKEFEPTWSIMRRNARINRGKHHSDKQETAIKNEERIPYSIPYSETKTNYILAQQMLHRYDWRVLGRDYGVDEVAAELTNHLFNYVKEINDFEYIETETFYDGFVKRYGAVERVRDYTDNPLGDVRIEKIKFDQVMWDTNIDKYSVSRYASWVQKFGWYTRTQVESMYPEKVDLINQISEDTVKDNNAERDITYWFKKEGKAEYIKLVWHYQRKWKTKYKVWNAEMAQAIIEEPIKAGESIDGFGQVIKVMPQPVEYIDIFCLTPNPQILLERYQLETKLIPIHIYFSMASDGEFWCLTDYIVDPQRFLDRLTMQMDFSLSKMVKGGNYEIDYDRIHKDDQKRWPEILKGLAKGGQWVKKRGPAPVVQPIDPGKIQPELFAVWELMIRILEESMGGRNVQGLTEGSNQSGIAIRRLQEAGFQLAYVFIDNLKRFKKELGEGLLEDIKTVYGSVNRTVRIVGEDVAQELLDILVKAGMYKASAVNTGIGYITNFNEIIGEAKTDLIISEGPATALYAEVQLEYISKLTELMVQNGMAPFPPTVYVKYMKIDPSIKRIMMEHFQSEIANRNAALEEEKRNNDMKAQIEIVKALRDVAHPPDEGKEEEKTEVKSNE